MAIPSRQIGWSTKANLLWQISKQLERLKCVTACGCGTTTTTTTAILTTTTTTTAYPCPTICALGDVTIGTQTWTGCNLDVETYANGDPITQVTDPTAWAGLTTGAWCYYNNDPLNGCTYGRLYNWYAVNDSRGIAPTGYHVPSEIEVLTLQSYLGGQLVAGGKMKEAGTSHWNSPNTGATNETGWRGLPGGSVGPGFGGMGITGPFWLADSYSPLPSMAYYMDTYNFNATLDIKVFDKSSGYNVRLIKDVSCCELPDITIGSQTWTACNLNVNTYQNGDLIPQVQDPVAWAALTTGAWCYYNNDVNNSCTYGKLYNWHAINDSRGLAPTGYHVPSLAEYNTLQSYLGGVFIAGGPLKEIGTTHWNTPNTGATNSSGWTGLPGGQRNYDSTFQYIQQAAAFWTSSIASTGNSTALQLYYTNDDFIEFPSIQSAGFSVRLISDIPAFTTTTTTLAPSGFNTIYTHFEAL